MRGAGRKTVTIADTGVGTLDRAVAILDAVESGVGVSARTATAPSEPRGNAGAPDARRRASVPRTPRACHGRERTALRAVGRRARLHRRRRIAERAPNDRPGGRVAPAPRRIRREGVP